MKANDHFLMDQQEFIDSLFVQSQKPGGFTLQTIADFWGMGPLMDPQERALFPTLKALANIRSWKG